MPLLVCHARNAKMRLEKTLNMNPEYNTPTNELETGHNNNESGRKVAKKDPVYVIPVVPCWKRGLPRPCAITADLALAAQQEPLG